MVLFVLFPPDVCFMLRAVRTRTDSCVSHWDMCSVTAISCSALWGIPSVARFPMAVAVKKRLENLERSQQLIAQLALAADKDVRQEKTRHELIVHLRGEAVDEVQQLFEEHVKSKESSPMTVPRRLARLRVMTRRRVHWLTPQPGIPLRLRRCGSSSGDGSFSASKLARRRRRRPAELRWLWLRQPNFTPMMGRWFCTLAVSIVEPLASEAMEKVWHLSLDFAFSGDGILAMQLLACDLQPFSYQDVTFHKASSRPGTLAKNVADLCEHSRPRRS